MSGGSFNYLCFNADSIGQLDERREELEAMENWLREYGYEAAADATSEIVGILDKAEAATDHILKQCKLEGVWQAVEWVVSNDWGPGHLADRLQAFEEASK